MIKLIKRTILLFFLVTFAFFYISVKYGGESFRFVGDTFHKGTADLGETADLIKESSDSISKTVRETTDAIEKTTTKLRETGSKISKTVKVTAKAVEDTSQSLQRTMDITVGSFKQVSESMGQKQEATTTTTIPDTPPAK